MLLERLNEVLLVNSQNKCLINVNSPCTNFPKEHKIFSSTKSGRKLFYLTEGPKVKEQEVLSSETTPASFNGTFTKTVGVMRLSESFQDYITLKLSVSKELNSPLRCIFHVSSHGK